MSRQEEKISLLSLFFMYCSIFDKEKLEEKASLNIFVKIAVNFLFFP